MTPVPPTLGVRWGGHETADAVADLLAARRGTYVSGERLRRKLGFTRSAVWKAVRQLQREGYAVTSSPRRGYRIAAEPDLLLPRLIRAGLKTKTIGAEVASFRRAGSTNDIGLWLAEHGCADGTVITAETQWGGRGRLGRSWHSPAGAGLWFSVVLRPRLPLVGAQALTFLGAVAAAQAIRQHWRLPVTLKWPNDLMLEGRKLGGVLTEVAAESDLIRHAVVGVGLNVNLEAERFPAALRGTAVSLSQVLGRPVSRVDLLREILAAMDTRSTQLRSPGGAARLVEEWRELTPMIGSIVRVAHLATVREGTVVGVDPDGALLLRTPAGTVDRLLAGDVTLLR